MWTKFSVCCPFYSGPMTLWLPCGFIKLAKLPLKAIKGNQTVALVAQKWYTWCSGIDIDAIAAIKLWICSKQLRESRRGGWLLHGCSDKAERRHTHCPSCKINAQWLANGWYIINKFCCKPYPPIWTKCLPPLHRPTPFFNHGNSWATSPIFLPPFRLLPVTHCASRACLWVEDWCRRVLKGWRSRHDLMGLGDPWSACEISLLLQSIMKVTNLCKAGVTEAILSRKSLTLGHICNLLVAWYTTGNTGFDHLWHRESSYRFIVWITANMDYGSMMDYLTFRLIQTRSRLPIYGQSYTYTIGIIDINQYLVDAYIMYCVLHHDLWVVKQ